MPELQWDYHFTTAPTASILLRMEADHPELHGFSLRYSGGWAVLIIPPEDRRVRPVYADDIAARMRMLGIPPVPAKKIRRMLEKAKGLPERLVPWPDGIRLSARVEVTVSGDAMEAWAVTEPAHPGGRPLTRQDVEEALTRAGVVKGISRESLAALTAATGPTQLMVARGEEPAAGKPAHSECLFVTLRGKPWKEIRNGRMDLRELNFIQNRKQNDRLTRLVEAVPPKEGFDVRGAVLPAAAVEDEPALLPGRGTELKDDGIYALEDGNVRLEGLRVIVEPSVTVKNVDYSTGNIDFDGSVFVEATVADGFRVSATGDIEVGKTVGRVHLETKGNLVLHAGMVGGGEGVCQTGENLYTKFLESSRVSVGRDLIVTEAVLHSEVEAGGHLMLTEGRGEITGGLLAVGGCVGCKRIGNVYSGATRIFAGCAPEKLSRFNELASRLMTVRNDYDNSERELDYLRSRPSLRDAALKVEQGLEKCRAAMKTIAGRLKEMKRELIPGDGVFITASERIYPGARLSFGLQEFPLSDKGLEKALIRFSRGKATVHGMKPGEEVELPW